MSMYGRAAERFASAMLSVHQTIEAGTDLVMPMCTCGRPAAGCEVLCTGRDAGLLPPLTSRWTAGPTR